jgi:hypothetical protein
MAVLMGAHWRLTAQTGGCPRAVRLLAAPGARFTLFNWEIYGHIFDGSTPAKLVGHRAHPFPAKEASLW